MARDTMTTAPLPTRRFWLLVGALVLVTNAATGALAWRWQSGREMERIKNQFPLLDPSRSLVPQEHFIVNLQPLREDLHRLASEKGPDDIAVYIEYLNTGANIAINPDLKIWPASLAKVPLAMTVMKKVERGEWKLTNELVLLDGDRDSEWGTLHQHPIGTRFTVEELLRELLTKSDNTAYRILYRNLPKDELEGIITEVGLAELFDDEGKISAKEYSRLFRALYVSSYLMRKNSQRLLEWLSQSSYDQYLGQGIPDHVRFSHKIGENDDLGVILDAGIVYVPNRPYLITVAINSTGVGGRDSALSIMKEISEKTYQYVANR